MLFTFKLINRNYLLICNSVYDDRYNFTYIVHRSVTAATIALDLHCSMQKNRILNICRHSLMHARYYLPNVCHGIYWVSWHLVQLGRWKLRVKSDIPHFGISVLIILSVSRNQKQFCYDEMKVLNKTYVFPYSDDCCLCFSACLFCTKASMFAIVRFTQHSRHYLHFLVLVSN